MILYEEEKKIILNYSTQILSANNVGVLNREQISFH